MNFGNVTGGQAGRQTESGMSTGGLKNCALRFGLVHPFCNFCMDDN